MNFILSAVGGFVIGIVTSLFDLGYFTGNWELNLPGTITNVILCFLWVAFVHFVLYETRQGKEFMK